MRDIVLSRRSQFEGKTGVLSATEIYLTIVERPLLSCVSQSWLQRVALSIMTTPYLGTPYADKVERLWHSGERKLPLFRYLEWLAKFLRIRK